MFLERSYLFLIEATGEDWWEEPKNLREKLILAKFNAAPMRPLPGEVMIRRGNHNWTKWEYIHKSRGGYTTTLHFWKSPQGERVEPKFKYVSPSKGINHSSVTKRDSPIDYAIQKSDMPQNLREKLVYEIVMSGEAPENERPVKFKPTKQPFIDLYNRGWRKWMHRHYSLAGCATVVHFWKSKKNERIFPKFSRVRQSTGLERICAWRNSRGLSLQESSRLVRQGR